MVNLNRCNASMKEKTDFNPLDYIEPFNPFKSLVTSIIGQQISWLAARSVTHSFTRVFFPHLPLKLAPPVDSAPPATGTVSADPSPFPTPTQVVEMLNQVDRLRAAGLSGRKVEYVVDLAERFHDGRLDAKKLWAMSDQEVEKTLLAIRGIGPWTLHMFEIFSMKRPDVLAVGDLVRFFVLSTIYHDPNHGIQKKQGIQKGLLKWFGSNIVDIHPAKLALQSIRETTPESQPIKVDSYPTPRTPSNAQLTPSIILETTYPRGNSLVFPKTSNNLTPAILKARLGQKKVK